MISIKDIIGQDIYLTDGGLETDLIYNKNIDLPHFAAFPLLEDPRYLSILNAYYAEYMDLAKKYKTGYILESPTWRANKDWGYKLGFSKEDLTKINVLAIEQLKKLKSRYTRDIPNILISGQIGPREDGYQIKSLMSVSEAEEYHKLQIEAFKSAKVNLVSAITMNYTQEALGIVYTARSNNLPAVISFTVETNGNLPSGESLEFAIKKIDKLTNNYPLYYMINCAHPNHFIEQLKKSEYAYQRIHGLRVNASCKSHEELDASEYLDRGDLENLGNLHVPLKKLLPNLKVFGGCCGTDVEHIDAICRHIIK